MGFVGLLISCPNIRDNIPFYIQGFQHGFDLKLSEECSIYPASALRKVKIPASRRLISSNALCFEQYLAIGVSRNRTTGVGEQKTTYAVLLNKTNTPVNVSF